MTRFTVNGLVAIATITVLETVKWTLGADAAHIAGALLVGACVGWWLNDWSRP